MADCSRVIIEVLGYGTAVQRSRSAALHDHSTALCYAKHVFVIMHFRHVATRRFQRFVVPHP